MRLRVKSYFLLFLLAGAVNALSADGRILSVEGDVRVNGQPVTADTELQRDDTIVTAAGASVKIVLSDNSVLDLDSGSEIRLRDYSYNPSAPTENKSDISVVEGTLRYVSGLIAKEDPDDIGFTAGNSTIGVRGSFTEIEVDGVVVNVEAMIGEATLILDGDQKDAIVVPTGQTTLTDPKTGKTVVTASTMPNKINEVVRAIAAAAPDASNRLSTDEGCSEGVKPLRDVAHPATDAETAAAIEAQLAGLSEGELMMVMAVMINNAGHLCIDSSTVAATIAMIATVRPDAVPAVVKVANQLDPDDSDKFNEAAKPPTGSQVNRPPRRPVLRPTLNQTEVPPGDSVGEPPSPE